MSKLEDGGPMYARPSGETDSIWLLLLRLKGGHQHVSMLMHVGVLAFDAPR